MQVVDFSMQNFRLISKIKNLFSATLRCQLNEQGQINEQGGFLLNTFVCLCVCFFLHVSLVPNKRVYSSIWHPRVLGLAQKHICNIIEEIVFRHSTFLLLSKTISSIMFQICFLVSHSQDRVFKISKIIQNFDQKYIS